MVMTTNEAEQVMSARKRSGTKLGVIHNMLFEPVMIKALSLIRKGNLGQIINADVRFLHTNEEPILSNRSHWCHSLQGGRFGEILPHPIYLLQALLGQIDIELVSIAKIGDYPWIPADELFVALGRNKTSGSIYISFNSPVEAVIVSVYGTKSVFRIDLTGETIVQLKHRPFNRLSKGINNLRQIYQLASSTLRATSLILSGKWSNGHETYIRGFVDYVLNEKDPPVTLQEAYNTVETLERICKKIDFIVSHSLRACTKFEAVET